MIKLALLLKYGFPKHLLRLRKVVAYFSLACYGNPLLLLSCLLLALPVCVHTCLCSQRLILLEKIFMGADRDLVPLPAREFVDKSAAALAVLAVLAALAVLAVGQ